MLSEFTTHTVVLLLLAFVAALITLAKTAILSARRARLVADGEGGNLRAREALRLAERPPVVVATSKVVVTFLAVTAGAYGGVVFTPAMVRVVRLVGFEGGSFAVVFWPVVAAVSGLFVVLSDFVPRSLAMAYPEVTAKVTAPLFGAVVAVMAPPVRILEWCAAAILSWVRLQPAVVDDEGVTEEAIKSLIEQGTESGVFHPTEEQIFAKVFRFADKRATALMTPRNEVIWLDVEEPVGRLWEKVRGCSHSYFPVARGSIDVLLGIASIKDVCDAYLAGRGHLDEAVLREAFKVPSATSALGVLERFKEERKHLALVIDEYGGVDGIITTHDLTEALVGHMADERATIVKRGDGSHLVDASLDLDDVMDFLKIRQSGSRERVGYHSLGGLVMGRLGHLPREGEWFDHVGHRFEVVGMDGHRIGKVLISSLPQPRTEGVPPRPTEEH
jgi:putative hemolysin